MSLFVINNGDALIWWLEEPSREGLESSRRQAQGQFCNAPKFLQCPDLRTQK